MVVGRDGISAATLMIHGETATVARPDKGVIVTSTLWHCGPIGCGRWWYWLHAPHWATRSRPSAPLVKNASLLMLGWRKRCTTGSTLGQVLSSHLRSELTNSAAHARRRRNRDG